MAQFANNQPFIHMSIMKRIFCYLSEIMDYVICYGNSNNPKLYGYVNSDWGDYQQTFHFITGYIFFKNGSIVSHSLKHQPTIAYLFIKAEYTVLCQVTKKRFGYIC